MAFAYVAASGVRYADAVEYARKRAELLAAAQKEGKEVTPELLAEIDALALSYVNAGDAAEKASQQLQQVEENAKTGAGAIGNIFGAVLEGSGAAKRAVAQLLLEIAKAQMMSAAMGMFGGTGFARLLGGLLNVGANAGGTSNWRGGLTRINELGGEIMNLPKGTQIIPADVSKRIADRAGQSARRHRHQPHHPRQCSRFPSVVVGEDPRRSLAANSTNKDISTISGILRTVNDMKRLRLDLPLEKLAFTEGEQNTRLPLSDAWILDHILRQGTLNGLNDQAQDILRIMINTGCRPAEIAGLLPGHIHLEHDDPHISIEPEGRQLKRFTRAGRSRSWGAVRRRLNATLAAFPGIARMAHSALPSISSCGKTP